VRFLSRGYYELSHIGINVIESESNISNTLFPHSAVVSTPRTSSTVHHLKKPRFKNGAIFFGEKDILTKMKAINDSRGQASLGESFLDGAKGLIPTLLHFGKMDSPNCLSSDKNVFKLLDTIWKIRYGI
ncbi:hypothetical protein L9F63_026943, partial [Diploptera punctata]